LPLNAAPASPPGLPLSSQPRAIELDGRIDPEEWAGAHRFEDFLLTQPLSLQPSPYPTEAWVLATPAGLAVAIRSLQPVDVPRVRTRTRRDGNAQVDRVNVAIDFDGDGRTGYSFMVTLAGGIGDEVITNESNYDADWDGNWRHAVSEDDAGWNVEMLIPWYIAPMREGEGGTRTVGMYIDRVIGATGERVATPGASFKRARFLSDF